MAGRDAFVVGCYRQLLEILPSGLSRADRSEAVDDFARLVHDARTHGLPLGAWRLLGLVAGDAVSATARTLTLRTLRELGAWKVEIGRAPRILYRAPLFSAVVVLTIGLSIGAVTAVMILADPMVFRALPYPDADRVVRVSATAEGSTRARPLTQADAIAMKTASTLAASGGFYGPALGRLTDTAIDEELLGYPVTEGFLDVLGTQPALGRLFTDAEYARALPDRRDAHSTEAQPLVLTHELWQRAFGGDPGVLGETLTMVSFFGPEPVVVVGVLRPDFVFPDRVNRRPLYLLPGRYDEAALDNPNARATIYARIRRDIAPEAALAELQSVLTRMDEERQDPDVRTAQITPVRDLLFANVRPRILLLLAVCISVLVLAVANLVHLSLARATERSREILVRRAMGASQLGIARLLTTESLILSLIGTAVALVAGKLLFSIAMAVVPRLTHVYSLIPAALDARVVAASVVTAATAFVVFGVAPALVAARRGAVAGVGSAGSRVHRGWSRGDRVLTMVQSGVAVGVVITGALFVTSFINLVQSVRGIDYSDLHYLFLHLPREYSEPENNARAHAFYQEARVRLEDRLGTPVAVTTGLPGVHLVTALRRLEDAPDSPAFASAYPANRAFLDQVRVELVAGRLYSSDESLGNAPVAVVDERAAGVLWPDAEAVGQTVRTFEAPTPVVRTVVGVVRTVTFHDESSSGRAFVPIDPAGRANQFFLLRGPVTPRFAQEARDIAVRLEPAARVEITPVQPFERWMGEPRFIARIVGVLAGVALLLTAAGIFASVSHRIAGRTAEVGVRLALGATPSGIVRMIVREALMPAIAGVAIGSVAGIAWARTLRSLLFEVSPLDPAAFSAATVLVLGACLCAAAIPGLKASRAAPGDALRAE